MAGAKKFGTFGGVFTPSILTILGVIMYMRLGWVVGNAGLYGTIIIILIAHVISITTGLSISSIATDKKVGAGGVYYVLSRSLGLPIGGAIGVTLFAGTALSIALYLVGFAESFNAYLGLDTSINGLRIGGTVALIALATIALISTAVAIKTQYFILAAIAISLVTIFGGSWEFAPAVVPSFASGDGIPMETIFAIFFPAVTGFTAGIAMSGDLQDPKKSIPSGTIAAILVGFVIYVVLAIFIAYAIDPVTLRSDNNILMKISLFAPVVAAGIWGATLSSALGGILGGPRILQAMSVDKITPRIFGKGVGKDNEPRNALFITLIIAQCGVLIGELDLIARVVSMFYLAAYGFINLSFFLESWASADFSPSFKVKRWIGLVGFMATFAVMFKLDMIAMFAAFIIIGGIYAFLQRKQLALGSGDIWHSVWSSLVLTGLKRMDESEDVKRNWKPNILLFSGSKETRPHLIEIAKGIAGKVGMISNFHLVENPEAQVLFPKHKQSLHDPFLIKEGIFGRQQEVQNIYQGIETIASTYGFSGVEPNTVLLGWAKNTKDPLMFAQMTQKLIELDYNVLYLDYDWDKKFGKYQKIDIWWQNLKNNAELTLNIAKFISNAPKWQKASIRLFLINDTNKEGFERKIHQQLDTYRIEATVKVINNYLEQRSSFDLMKSNSQDADLIIAGIPETPVGEEKDFVDKTTEMFGILGTTLLVKTSSILGEDETQLPVPGSETLEQTNFNRSGQLIPLEDTTIPALKESIQMITQEIEDQSIEITETELASFQNIYNAFARECQKEAIELLHTSFPTGESDGTIAIINIKEIQKKILDIYLLKIERFENEDLGYLEERLNTFQEKFNSLPARVLPAIPEKLKPTSKVLPLRKLVKAHFETYYQRTLQKIHLQTGQIDLQLNEEIKNSLIQSVRSISNDPKSITKSIEHINKTFEELLLLIKNRYFLLNTSVRNKGRMFVNTLIQKIEKPADYKNENKKAYNKKELKTLAEENSSFKSYWYRNQKCLIAKLSTDLKLQQINLVIDQIGDHILEEMNMAMFHNTSIRLDEAQTWLDDLEQNPQINSGDLPEINQSLSYDDHKIEELMILAESQGKILPKQLTLIEPDSLQNFASAQGEIIESVTIDSQATFGYLIYDKLQRPLQKHLLSAYQASMEILSKVQYDINQIVQTINNARNEISPEDLNKMASNAKANIIEQRQQLSFRNANKKEILSDIIHTANSSLNTASLLEHAVRILPTEHPEVNKKGIKKWLGEAGNKAGTLLEKYGDLIVSKRELIRPGNAYSPSRSPATDMHYELKKFVHNLTIEEKVAAQLPFYYKQLFVGKLAPNIDQLHHRENELRQAFSMLRSPNTDEHAIIVLGEPLSGKSFFSEAVARSLDKKRKIIKIQPPVSGSIDKSEFLKTLQKQLKSTTKNSSILKEAPEGAIFLFEDLELWWDRGHPDGKLIRFIVKLINQYRAQYSFIINCNVFAFKIMEGQGLLEYLSGSQVYLSNFDLPSLQALLLERHNAGGLILSLNGKEQDEITNKNIKKLMEKIRQNSNGVVGIALRQWISNIKEYQNDTVEIDFPKEQALPMLENKEWLVILSQFLIHKHLDAARLQKLFGFADRSQADMIIRQLSADGIIEDIMGRTFQLNPLVQVWVINRAREFSLI
ncbi:MAG: amino acid transporter [Saprospiraceae bacterium]|jgi:amino acid transporter